MYDPVLARFVSADSVVPGASAMTMGPDKASNGPADPQQLNRFSYVSNNPVKNTDPTGHWLESAIDIASIAYDVYDISQNGLTLTSGLALAADVVSLALPVVAGGGAAVRAIAHADDVVGAVAHADEAVDAARAVSKSDELVPASDLYFSQKGINWKTGGGVPLDDLSQDIAGGWKGDSLRVLEVDDKLVSLDNRRLAAAKLIDADVPIRKVSLSDPKIKRIWEQRDGIYSSTKIRGTGYNMRIDRTGRIHGID